MKLELSTSLGVSPSVEATIGWACQVWRLNAEQKKEADQEKRRIKAIYWSKKKVEVDRVVRAKMSRIRSQKEPGSTGCCTSSGI